MRFFPALLALLVLLSAVGCDSDDGGGDDRDPPRAEGLAYAQSDRGVAGTFDTLDAALQAAPPVSVLARLDHAENAASVGLDLPPTRVLFFGNPALGTPLMQDEQTIGLDLPQKMLVYEDAGGAVRIAYNDPFFLAERHGIDTGGDEDDDSQQERLTQIANALEGLATQAASSGGNGG